MYKGPRARTHIHTHPANLHSIIKKYLQLNFFFHISLSLSLFFFFFITVYIMLTIAITFLFYFHFIIFKFICIIYYCSIAKNKGRNYFLSVSPLLSISLRFFCPLLFTFLLFAVQAIRVNRRQPLLSICTDIFIIRTFRGSACGTYTHAPPQKMHVAYTRQVSDSPINFVIVKQLSHCISIFHALLYFSFLLFLFVFAFVVLPPPFIYFISFGSRAALITLFS